MPFMALTGGYYAVFFAMSVFFFPTPRPLAKYGVQISGLSVEGLTLVLVGVGLMIGSYFLAEKIYSTYRASRDRHDDCSLAQRRTSQN